MAKPLTSAEERAPHRYPQMTCGVPGAVLASPRLHADSFHRSEVSVSGYEGKIILLGVSGNPNIVLRDRFSLGPEEVSNVSVTARGGEIAVQQPELGGKCLDSGQISLSGDTFVPRRKALPARCSKGISCRSG